MRLAGAGDLVRRHLARSCHSFKHVAHARRLASSNAVAWGANDDGRLGIACALGVEYVRTRSTRLIDRVSQLLLRPHEVFDNPFINDSSTVHTPKCVGDIGEDALPVVYDQVSCGPSHTLLLDSQGRVFACGDNAYGQLGLGFAGDCIFHPLPVTFDRGAPRVVAVAAGHSHSLFVLENGEVYSCGLGHHGQLGIRPPDASRGLRDLLVVIPTRIDALCDAKVRIDMVAAGDNFSLALESATGKVFSFGVLDRLGHNELPHKQMFRSMATVFRTSATNEPLPRLIVALKDKRIDRIWAGPWGAYASSSTDRKTFSWGRGIDFFHGDRHELDHAEPQQVRALDGVEVCGFSSSGSHHGAVTASGRLLMWGSNMNNCLGIDEDRLASVRHSEPIHLESLPDTSHFHAGFRFSAAVSQGQVYSWGCGESGARGIGFGYSARTPELVRDSSLIPEHQATTQYLTEHQHTFPPLRARAVSGGYMHCIALKP
ncbi:Ultraviolet-B receptor UVR8 [Porphyridium purpureum]|uniref:Ultraviolet-B receptor UVR8 n=1 Tax=Porphyridium purpureum TaxID=35688 RepID=A0A5J4Z047_PORPP|nr:Ultraviolet-B receptor UVR8 [Porphyridium purpureum]|eukprot:POR9504..scf208_2